MVRAIAKSIIGQIYPAAILARLVTLELVHERGSRLFVAKSRNHAR
jgi:hypothetical protein